MDRAYSLLTVKSIDDDERIISGIATSPTPDRMGDIVEPLGVEFKNPLPLLHQHRSAAPVGLATFKKPTKDGIEFTAKIPKIEEPGELKSRIDTAWGEVKAGLVRGVSIGFRAIESSFMDDGGMRFIRSEVMELSLVTIPANAEATIQTIKSIDNELLAASGRERRVVKTQAGASAKRNSVKAEEARHMKKTIGEQIQAFEATRQAKAARLDEIMDAAAEKGETLDDAAKQEYDDLEAELKEIDEHLVRLRAREKTQLQNLEAVKGESESESARSRDGGVSRVIVRGGNVPKGIPFTRVFLANARSSIARANGHYCTPLDVCQSQKEWQSETPEVEMTLRAAVAAGTTTGTTWAAPLVQYQVLASEFAEFLRPLTVIGRIPGLRRVPFKVAVPRMTGGLNAAWVGENKSAPLSAGILDSVTLDHFKIAGISALSRELVQLSNPSAEAIVRDDLAAAVAQLADNSFTDELRAEVAGVSPASVTYGVTPVAASGTAYANFATDFRSVMGTFLLANITPDTVIMSQAQALAFSLIETSLGVRRFPGLTMTGGEFLGMNCVASENLSGSDYSPAGGTSIIFLRASEIMLADEGGVEVDVSTEASVQMDSAPTDPITASQVLVSFWQQGLVGVRVTRMVNWKKRRPLAVHYISLANYVT